MGGIRPRGKSEQGGVGRGPVSRNNRREMAVTGRFHILLLLRTLDYSQTSVTSLLKWKPVCYCLSLCSLNTNLRLVAVVVKGRRSFVAKYATKVWVSFFWAISIKHKAPLCPQKMRRGMLIRPALQTSPCHSHLARAASAGGLVAAAPGPCAQPFKDDVKRAPVYVSLRSRGSDSGVNAVNPIANLPHICILPLVRCMVLEVGRVTPRVKGSLTGLGVRAAL